MWDLGGQTNFRRTKVLRCFLLHAADHHSPPSFSPLPLPPASSPRSVVHLLPLSSQELPSITSLEGCTNLIFLNLSCNNLTSLGAGLSRLSLLERLDLTQNKLRNLDDGLHGLLSLTFLALEGNGLGDVADLHNLAKVAPTLTSLYYRSDCSEAPRLTNAVAGKEGYAETIAAVLPSLRVLDGESVGLKEAWKELGVGEGIEADARFSRELLPEDWLEGVPDGIGEEGEGKGGGGGGAGEGSALDGEDAKVLKEVLSTVNADLGKAKAVLKAADEELTKMHLM